MLCVTNKHFILSCLVCSTHNIFDFVSIYLWAVCWPLFACTHMSLYDFCLCLFTFFVSVCDCASILCKKPILTCASNRNRPMTAPKRSFSRVSSSGSVHIPEFPDKSKLEASFHRGTTGIAKHSFPPSRGSIFMYDGSFCAHSFARSPPPHAPLPLCHSFMYLLHPDDWLPD